SSLARKARSHQTVVEIHDGGSAQITEVRTSRNGARVESRLPSAQTGSTANHAKFMVCRFERALAFASGCHRALSQKPLGGLAVILVRGAVVDRFQIVRPESGVSLLLALEVRNERLVEHPKRR